MSQIVLKDELSDTLSAVTDRSELVNERGELIGIFMPAKGRSLPLFGSLTEEEIERRRQQPGKYTLAEIWKSLGVSP